MFHLRDQWSWVVVGVLCVGVVCVTVGVVVVVLVLVVVFGVVCGGGRLRERLFAEHERIRVQLCDAFLKPVAQARSTVGGSALKSRSVFRIAASVATQLPPAFSAAWATVSKSLCRGPAFSTGISPAPELPQETSSATATPSSGAAGEAEDRPRNRHVARVRSVGPVR